MGRLERGLSARLALVTLLKIRASYGKTANDLLDSQRFSYMDDLCGRCCGGTVTAYRYLCFRRV